MGFDALSFHRLAARLTAARIPYAPALIARLSLRLFSASLPPSVVVGEGTRLGFGGVGVFVHPSAVIGRSCLIAQFVSIGGYAGTIGAARIGDYVRVGVGARLLGPITVGDFAVIGANAVVLRDVPAGAVVFGVPARVVRTPDNPVSEYELDTGWRVGADDRAAFERVRRQAGGAPNRLVVPPRSTRAQTGPFDPAEDLVGPPLELVGPELSPRR